MATVHLVTGCGGSAHVTAADHGSLNAAFFGEGQYVLNRGNVFAISKYTVGSITNAFKILDGDLLMNGRHIRINPSKFVVIGVSAGTSGYNRNDLVVCRYTKNTTSGIEECTFTVITGTRTTGTAADPTYNSGNILKGDTTVEFPLYRIPIRGTEIGTPVPLFTVLDTYSNHLDQVAASKPKCIYPSGDYTVTESDNGNIIEMATGKTLTLPDLPDCTEVKVSCVASGTVTVKSTDSYICVPGGTTGRMTGYITGAWALVTFTKVSDFWIAQGSAFSFTTE